MSSNSVAVATILLSSALVSFGAYSQQASAPVEPESIGALNYLDSVNGTLKALPMQPMEVVGKAGLVHATGVFRVSDPHSSLRLKAGEKVEFVVRLACGTDPDKYMLYAFNTKKKYREAEISKAGVFKPGSKTMGAGIPRDTFKFGESSYKFSFKGLATGEYAFVANFQAFSFGIDPQ